MNDPQASLILAAENTTDAAFAAANRNLTALETGARRASSNMGAAFSGLRSALGFLGVALSGRMFVGWVTGAVRAAEATGEHAEQIKAAQEALESMKRASDELALSLGVKLAPALSAVAIGWNRILTGADPNPFEKEFNAASHNLDVLKRKLEDMDKFGGFRFSDRDKLVADIAAAELAKAAARMKSEQALGVGLGALRQGFGDVKFSDEDRAAIREKETILQQRLNELTRQSLDDREAEFDLVTAVYAEKERVAALEIEQSAELAEAVAKERDRVAQEEDEQADRRRVLLEQHVEDVRLNLLTEVEYQAESYARQQEMLDQALQDKLLSQQEHADLSVQLEKQTSQRIDQIRRQDALREKQGQLQKLALASSLISGLASIAEAGANQSKKQFELSKHLRTADALINTYAGITQALAAYPPPLSFAWAAAVAAQGFAQVRAIQSQSWSGGGGFGALGGGGGGAVASAPTINDRTAGLLSGDGSGGRGGPHISVYITGLVGRVDGETAREIGRAVREQIDDYDFEIMSPSSRQVMTIRGEGVQDEGP